MILPLINSLPNLAGLDLRALWMSTGPSSDSKVNDFLGEIAQHMPELNHQLHQMVESPWIMCGNLKYAGWYFFYLGVDLVHPLQLSHTIEVEEQDLKMLDDILHFKILSFQPIILLLVFSIIYLIRKILLSLSTRLSSSDISYPNDSYIPWQ